ncbi:MAG: NAD-dependent epimerase/dehydratase family protein, partial [Beijerinckiaceae bacterium]
VQAEGARTVARAAARAGIRDLVQMSAIGADAGSAAVYAQSKAAGETAALAEVPSSVILRPSIVFGPEDNFFNQFAGMARVLPFLPLIGGGETKFQPVFVGDVAEAVAAALDGKARPGAAYELGGPAVMSFRQILEYILAETGRSRPLVPLPFPIAELQGRMLELLPFRPLLTRDQVLMLKSDNVVSAAAKGEGRTLEGLGVAPESVESIVPSYLYRFRKAGQFEREKAA